MSRQDRAAVFTLWAWLVLAPPLITAWGGYAAALTEHQRLVGMIAALVVHLIVGGCFWIGAIVERRLSATMRWLWFVAVLVVVSLVRPTAADLLQSWLGVHLEPPAFWTRVALNLIGMGAIMIIVYFAIEQVARSADSRRRIAAVLERSQQQQAATDVRQAALIVEYQRTIAGPIRQAMSEVDVRAPVASVAAQLMHVAHEVVRPLANRSFAMAGDATEYQYRQPRDPLPTVGRGRLQAPQRIEATLPWAPAAVWLILQLPIALLAYPMPVAWAATLASTAVCLLGCWLVRLHPLPSAPPLALGLLTLEYLAIGALGVLVVVLPDPSAMNGGIWVYGVLQCAVTAIALSLGRSQQLDYLVSERQLITTLLDARYRANAAHGQLATTTNLLARRLHAAIQTDLVAAAFQLRLGTADPTTVVTEVRARIDRVLAAPMLPTAIDDPAIDQPVAGRDTVRPYPEGIRAAIEEGDAAWREALELTTEYDDGLWLWLADHPECRALIREVGTWALTNVIRYGRARRARLRIWVEDDRLRIEVRSPGWIRPGAERLLGAPAFDGRVTVVEVVRDGTDIVHRVVT